MHAPSARRMGTNDSLGAIAARSRDLSRQAIALVVGGPRCSCARARCGSAAVLRRAGARAATEPSQSGSISAIAWSGPSGGPEPPAAAGRRGRGQAPLDRVAPAPGQLFHPSRPSGASPSRTLGVAPHATDTPCSARRRDAARGEPRRESSTRHRGRRAGAGTHGDSSSGSAAVSSATRAARRRCPAGRLGARVTGATPRHGGAAPPASTPQAKAQAALPRSTRNRIVTSLAAARRPRGTGAPPRGRSACPSCSDGCGTRPSRTGRWCAAWR